MEDLFNGKSEAIEKAIQQERADKGREQALISERYYDYEHDILENKIFYINDNDVLVEDPYAANIRIPHAFFTEIVDQAVTTELSNPVELNVDDETFMTFLEEYWNADIQLFLQEMVEGASKKGKEFAYIRRTAGEGATSKVTFQVSDRLQTFEVINADGDVVAIVRFYNRNLIRENEEVSVEHCEIWDEEEVTFYVKNEKDEWIKDQGINPNPRTHIIADGGENEETGEPIIYGESYGRIPFFKLKNNKKEKTDLEPIKELIDDYDLMNAMMSNNLQDYQGAIYVTKGFPGDDLNKLRQNVRGKGALDVGKNGEFDLKTYDIPVEGRIKKMEHDKANIYKFGMAFDSTAISDSSGSVTNVQIIAGYSLLMMKLNKKEKYLNTLIEWMLEIIVEDINRRYDANYNHSDIEVTITRETAANKLEMSEIAKNEEETKQLKITTLLDVAMFLPQEKLLREICEILELDWKEVEQLLKEEVHLESLAGVGDEEIEAGDEDATDEQVGETD